MSVKPRLAVSMGDPAGIGPEIAVRCATDETIARLADIFLFGAPDILEEASRRFAGGKPLKIVQTSDMRFPDLRPGELDPRCGRVAYETIKTATLETLARHFDAIVTCPANKAAVNAAGIAFSGHTEMIAELCGTKSFAMMQSSNSLRVVFATTHIGIADVPAATTRERIIEVATLLREAILAEGIAKPKLAIAALNPHAGEKGLMGMEDEKVVKPAADELRSLGFDLEGPFPPDTLFIEQIRTRFDGIIALYHDQGHIPFKMLAFDSGVNSTLGLPIIRTSVDHGTAFEIAWKGVASTGSLMAAIKLAAKRASHR